MVILPAIGIMLLVVAILSILGRHTAISNAKEATIPFLSTRISKEKYLQECYDLITHRFRSTSNGFIIYPWRNFFLGNIWDKGKVLPCQIQSKLLEQCLLQKFKKDDIRSIWVAFKHPMILHNFLEVKVNNKWISVDPWGRRHRIPLGENMLSIGYAGHSR